MVEKLTWTTAQDLPPDWFPRLTDLRVDAPEVIAEEAAARVRRGRLTQDGKLVILACDHPARHVNKVGADLLAMGNRRDYLARIVRILARSSVDGVMATPDVIDDLFLVNRLYREDGRPGFLDGKVLLGCLNRGGLAGASFELDDTMTAYTPESLVSYRLDGAKLMFRLNLAEGDSAKTILYCAEVMNRLSRLGIPAFLEPLPVVRSGDVWAMDLRADALIPVIGVAQALAESSARTWLKLPIVPEYDRVACATTCPILVLGGEAKGDVDGVLQGVAGAMAGGSNVRGALIGRNVIFPGTVDPAAMAEAVCKVVRGAPVTEAAAELKR